MSPLRALAWREVLAAVRTPRYYVLVAFYLFAQGYLFSISFLDDGAVAVRQVAREAAFLLLFAAPLVTASALAGEHRSGELRSLLSEPISEGQLVGGKALGSLLLLVPLALASLVPVAATCYLTAANPAPLLAATAGLALLAVTAAAAGVFTSSFSSHPAGAAVSGVALLLCLGTAGAQAAGAGLGRSFLTGDAGPDALNPFWVADLWFRGLLDTRLLVLAPGATALFLWLAVLVLRSRRFAWPAREGLPGEPGASGRSWLVASALLFRAAPAVALLVLALVANLRWHASWDLSGYLSLSPGFASLMDRLPGPLEIYRADRATFARDRLADLLDEVVRTGRGRVSVGPLTSSVLYGRLRRLGIVAAPRDGLVLRLGDRVAAVGAEQLDVESRFAERALAQALEGMLPDAPRFTVLFAEGHGERTPEPVDGGSLVALARNLRGLGFRSAPLSVQATSAVPVTSTVLAVVGPRSVWPPAEVAKVEAYLQAGGRLLVAVEPATVAAARPLLALVNAQAPGGTLLDATRSLAGGGPSSLILLPRFEHAVGAALGRNSAVVMPDVTPVDFVPPQENPLRQYVMTTYSSSHLTTSPQVDDRGAWRPAPATPVCLASEGPRDRWPWRALVLGDADVLTDRLQEYPTNAAFCLTAFTWLCQLPPPSTIPREPFAVKPALSKAGARSLLWATAVAPAALSLGLGFLAWSRWRRRFSPRGA